MSIESWLRRWLSAGLITAEQAERIAAFERVEPSERPTLLYAIAGLGALAIAVGLLSIVAGNWDAIPGRVKIGIDLGLVAMLGVGVWTWERRGPAWARETAITLLWGLVLASIALVGQIYQLGGRADEALLVWSLLTALLMTRARSGVAAMMWIFGLQGTWVVWVVESGSDELALATIYWLPLVCIAVGRLPWVRRARPALAATLGSIGWAEVVLCATLGTFAFYADTTGADWHTAMPAVAISTVITAAIAIALLSSPAERVLLFACLVLSHAPVYFSPGEQEVLAAASFVGLWLVVAWSAHHAGESGLLNLATAMIGMRIVAIYFEVFGTLLDTGVGLVCGGLLTLAVAWLWTRKRKQFAAELGSKGGA